MWILAPDRRRRIIKLSIVLVPILAWLITAMYKAGATPSQVDWRLLAAWILATPKHTELIGALACGLLVALAIAIALQRSAKSEGYDGAGYKKHIRGTEAVPIGKLIKRCTEPGQQQIDVAGVPMPTAVENLHLLLNGATGTGKSILLRSLAFSALKRGDRLVVVDPNGDLYSKFGRPADILLNAFDARTAGWSIFNEARAVFDWERLAMSVVPLGRDANQEEWNGYGRLLLREAARKLQELGSPSIEELFRWCTIASDKDLRTFLSGTLAESLFAGSSEASKALTSARFVLSKYLAQHMRMPPGDFAIRDWLVSGTSSLYMTWREDMKAASTPLLSAWVDVFCASLLSLPEDPNRRIWLLIDELASLEKLPTLVDFLTKARKNGGRCVAGLQTIAQLDDIYGQKMAETLRACFRSLVVLGGARDDPNTAEEMSKALGEHEVARPEFTDSRNPGSARNTSERMVRSTERVVTASEIQHLPDKTGWLGFAADKRIAKFKLQPINFAQRNEPFIAADRAGPHRVTAGAAPSQTPWSIDDFPQDPTQA